MTDALRVIAGELLWSVDRADAVAWLAALPADSVDLLFCSPPYEKARTYAEGGDDPGIARDTDAWVAWMLDVCEAARRVCKGLCAFVVEGQTRSYRYTASPFLLVADLHRRGFNLRKPPIYRRVGIPGSGGPDWLRNDYEPVVCFTRPGKLPWSDPTACGHPPRWAPGGAMSHRLSDGTRVNQWGGNPSAGSHRKQDGSRQKTGRPSHRTVTRFRDGMHAQTQPYDPPALANPGNVIDCQTGHNNMGSPLCHENEAPFPEDLAEFFVLTFCPPGGIVCDPFSGSGTTAAVAFRNGRRAIACDCRASQVELSRRRIGAETPSLFTPRAGGNP